MYVCDSVKCNEDQQRIARRAKRHGITYDRYSEIHLNQGGRCPVCGEHLGKFDKDVVIDHDHSCCPKRTSCGECVRGILHRRCNSAIGYLRDDPDTFERIAEYLRGFRGY
ncbi:endonuclease VII domain-containing protein (plasmid) [Streptomyces viridifaciens]|uniref:endonuclease VII domain-containing protein n=1 Tax=Kitasatospora aureofaciens TaxID=1894 RepID=UPI00093498D5|nr:endonuclease VII domain-containing protein [Streptomyces viridifaciens]